VATWNVNSAKQRLPRLLPWLDERQPDVVCLQETKLADAAFAELLGEQLGNRGYAFAVHGEAQWNGVAILSRAGLDDVVSGLPGAPGFPDPEARAVSATCGGIRVHCVYVPNGREPNSEHYRYKLAWLRALRDTVAVGPDAVIVAGDVNIAPADEDVFDPSAYVGHTHVTAPERAALRELQALGLRDVVRERWPSERVFSYWDYRAGMFHQDLGMRIDLVLASAVVADRVKAAWIDRQARKGKGPSDHAPVIVDLDEAPDGEAAEAAADAEEQEEDLLGVEIEITPAGKAMKRLSLLSGGEKSMTALAFLFSVFLARPCPFYILDEVEAALDDLNIDRFLTLLRKYAERAQFIVVTHQKRTMEAADSLYGVSMGGDGISKVISRKLPPAAQAAEAEVA